MKTLASTIINPETADKRIALELLEDSFKGSNHERVYIYTVNITASTRIQYSNIIDSLERDGVEFDEIDSDIVLRLYDDSIAAEQYSKVIQYALTGGE